MKFIQRDKKYLLPEVEAVKKLIKKEGMYYVFETHIFVASGNISSREGNLDMLTEGLG